MKEFEKSKVGAYDFIVMPFHCDFNNHLRIDHLGNDMLNAADFHSDARGFGMNYLNTINKTWVLSRFAIEIVDMPKSYEKIQVETWVENAVRFFTKRNFAVKDNNGKYLAYGKSIWAMIDTKTRQPTDLLAIHNGLLKEYIVKDKPCPIEPCSRVGIDENATLWQTVTARYSDIDMNGHVNSIKYIEHAVNLWDLEWYKQHFLHRVEIAYVAESHCNDKLYYYVEERQDNDFYIRICTDNNEVCRCNMKFATK